MILELIGHIVSDLTNCVEGGISDLGVGMGTVLKNDGNHHLDLLWIVDVLTNLTESHNTCVFESPVHIVGNSIHDKGANEGQHLFFADG